MTAPAPLLEALIAYLKAQAAISALVSTRVFGLSLPEDEAQYQPRKAVRITMAGSVGASNWNSYVEDACWSGFDVWCYGETEFESLKLYREVHRVLKRIIGLEQSGAKIHSANPLGSAMSLKDPDGFWPVVIENWAVLAAETATA